MAPVVTYEEKLRRNPRWALLEGSMHFENRSSVFQTLLKIAQRLDELGVPYAIAGGMALFLHGYRRFTEDVDILVSRDGLKIIHERLEGLGFVPPFNGSKNLRDVETGVRIEFLIQGDYPGDGKPKPISFPDPSAVGVIIDQIRVVGIHYLIELKLASGTAPGRLRDLADVQELIRHMKLGADFADRLDQSVRDLYQRLWREVNEAPAGPDQDNPAGGNLQSES
jgi:hypothetical protein